MKIGRYDFNINEEDMIFDNGACYQLITRRVGYGFNKSIPIVSKSQFNKLLKNNQIILESDEFDYFTGDGKEFRKKFYRFNIEKLNEDNK